MKYIYNQNTFVKKSNAASDGTKTHHYVVLAQGRETLKPNPVTPPVAVFIKEYIKQQFAESKPKVIK